MAARDVITAIGTRINSGLGRILYDAFNDGFDNDIKIAYGNKLQLEDSGGSFKELYVSGTTLVIPATATETLGDNVPKTFGDGTDLSMVWDATDFLVSVALDDTKIKWGDGTLSIDQYWYGNTAAQLMIFDASGSILDLNGVDIRLQDADYLIFGDSDDVTVNWNASQLVFACLADDYAIYWGNGTNSFDQVFYGNTASDTLTFDASGNILIANGVDIQVMDADMVIFGDSKDVTITWDGTNLIFDTIADDKIIEFGNAATPQLSFDLKIYGNSAAGADFLYFDASANLLYTTGIDVQFLDSDYLVFGTGAGASGDVNITWDGTNLIISTVADDKLIEIGDSAVTQLSFDMKWYANENSGASYLYLDASENLIYTVGVDLQFKDNDVLAFGTGASAAGDVSIVWDATNLIFKAAVDDTIIEIGDAAATQLSFDVKIYGNAANGADYFVFDAGASALMQGGAAEIQLGRHTVASISAKTADYTVVAADTGKLFVTTGASGAVIFTLPTLAANLTFTFFNTVDQNMTITSAAGNDIFVFNDLAASSLAFSTSSEKIGACCTITGTATGWVALKPCLNTMTIT